MEKYEYQQFLSLQDGEMKTLAYITENDREFDFIIIAMVGVKNIWEFICFESIVSFFHFHKNYCNNDHKENQTTAISNIKKIKL